MPVPVVLYGDDCLIRGAIDVGAGRLSDALNALEEASLAGVVVEPLDGAPSFALERLVIPLDEVALVELGPLVEPGPRRVRTARHRLTAEVGPWRVTATYHALPSLVPLATLDRRGAYVPMTTALVELVRGDGAPRQLEVDAVAINRQRIDAIHPALEAGWPRQVDATPSPVASDLLPGGVAEPEGA